MGGMLPWVRAFIFQANSGGEHRPSHSDPGNNGQHRWTLPLARRTREAPHAAM